LDPGVDAAILGEGLSLPDLRITSLNGTSFLVDLAVYGLSVASLTTYWIGCLSMIAIGSLA